MEHSPRPATSADYEAYIRFFGELGLPDDPIPDRDPWAAEWLPYTFFLDREGVPVAYAAVRALGDVGHLRHVVIDPGFRRLGIGRELMSHCAARLRAEGCTRWMLNVKAENTPAIALYEACGMAIAFRSFALALDWADVAALPCDEAKVVARIVAPDEDAAIEAAFKMPRGRLADRRSIRDGVVLRLLDLDRSDDVHVAIACVDPGFPGAFPFQVARPSLAAPLLDAIRSHVRPDDVLIRIGVEADDALAETLAAAGARVVHTILQMTGELPSTSR